MSALHVAADYLNALRMLMPRGRVWPKEPDAVQDQVLAGLTGVFEDVDADAQQLLVDANPGTTLNLLDEWESSLGLPDPCLGASPTTQQRQAAVLARYTAQGGSSQQFFIDYAANLGYAITITNDAPFRMGVSGMGDALGDASWYYVWHVTGSLDAVIECELSAIAPAHTTLLFG